VSAGCWCRSVFVVCRGRGTGRALIDIDIDILDDSR